jgi:hypothetical protein
LDIFESSRHLFDVRVLVSRERERVKDKRVMALTHQIEQTNPLLEMYLCLSAKRELSIRHTQVCITFQVIFLRL